MHRISLIACSLSSRSLLSWSEIVAMAAPSHFSLVSTPPSRNWTIVARFRSGWPNPPLLAPPSLSGCQIAVNRPKPPHMYGTVWFLQEIRPLECTVSPFSALSPPALALWAIPSLLLRFPCRFVTLLAQIYFQIALATFRTVPCRRSPWLTPLAHPIVVSPSKHLHPLVPSSLRLCFTPLTFLWLF
jgi:hypothetical protein